MNRLLRPLYLVAVLGGASVAAAEEPAPEPLPAPRQAPPALPAPLVLVPAAAPAYPPPQPSLPPEFGRMSVWQAFAPDRTGRMRPVVITTPYGAYYRIDHTPFPWTTTRYLEYMPYVVD